MSYYKDTMSWRSYLFPKTVLKTSSPHNRDIRVVEEKGKYKLLVNGSRQSGEYIQKLWQHAFTTFGIIPSPDVKRVLVLGVAGGTVIQLVHSLYPHAQIDGVDIDKQMVEVGKKYFSLGAIKTLHITVFDAKLFIARAIENRKTWDIIIIDIYVGASIPPFVSEETFFTNMKKIQDLGGIVIINYLYEFEYKNLSELLYQKLQKVFDEVKDTKIYFNRFFMVK